MKRFILFVGLHYYPYGGWEDFAGYFDSKEEAVEAGHEKIVKEQIFGWFHIVDTETNKIVSKYEVKG